MSHCFWYSDLVLYATGCAVFTDSWISKIINNLIFFLAVLRIGISSGLDVLHVEWTLTHSAQLTHWFFLWCFLLITKSKRRAIVKYVQQFYQKAGSSEVDIIRKQGIANLICITGYFVTNVCIIGTFYHMASPKFVFNRHVFAYFEDSVLVQAVAVTSMIFELIISSLWMPQSLFLYSVLHLMKHRVLIRCLRDVLKSKDPMKLIQKTSMYEQQFESLFSYITFLNLAANFLETAGWILSQITSNSGSNLKFIFMSYALQQLTTSLALVLIVTKRQDRIDEAKEETLNILNARENKTNDDMAIISAVEKLGKVNTAGRMVRIEQSSLATFVGNQITFAALFSQIAVK